MIIPRSFGVLRYTLYRSAAFKSFAARLCTSRQSLNSKSAEKTEVDDKPFPFMSQKYTKDNFDTAETFRPKESEGWKYQPLVYRIWLIFSFLYYYSRGEHEVDDRLAEYTYVTFPKMEIHDLRRKIIEYRTLGLYTQHLEDRLAKLTRRNKRI